MVASAQESTKEAVTWAVGTIVRKASNGQPITLPCQRGIAADGLSAIEIVGSGSAILSISFVAILPPNDEAVIRRNARMAEALLKKATPAWKGASAWLAGAMKGLKEKPHVKARIALWSIDLTFDPSANRLALGIAR